MKRFISLLFLGAMAAGGLAQIPLFDETDVFVGGQDDINTYRIPLLICSKKGNIQAYSEGNRDLLKVLISLLIMEPWLQVAFHFIALFVETDLFFG